MNEIAQVRSDLASCQLEMKNQLQELKNNDEIISSLRNLLEVKSKQLEELSK